MRTANNLLLTAATVIAMMIGCGTLPQLSQMVSGIIENPLEPPDDGVRPPVSPDPPRLLDTGQMWSAMRSVLGREPQPDELYLTHFDAANRVVWIAVYEWDGSCRGELKSIVGEEASVITLLASALWRRGNRG